MSLFTESEITYLQKHRIARIATAGRAGHPHVVPIGFFLDPDTDIIKIGQHSLEGRGQERLYLRHLRDNPRVALVVDDVDTSDGWVPSGIVVKGTVRFHDEGGEALAPGFGPKWLEVVPDSASSWGIDTSPFQPATPRRA